MVKEKTGNDTLQTRTPPGKGSTGNSTTGSKKSTPKKAPVGKHWVSVSLLDGDTMEKPIDKKATGEDLFFEVCNHMNLVERDYFGLVYHDAKNAQCWLNFNKLVAKQIKGDPQVWELCFEVKFYPPEPLKLQEDLTRYALCLQLRIDLLNPTKLPCSFMSLALLGSYTAQSELGDYDEVEHGHGIDYIRKFHFAPNQQDELLEKIAEIHRTHKGQTPSEAESNFLDNARKLAMYGVHMHHARDVEQTPVQLGVCSTGILVYHDRLRRNKFSWPKIINFSYKGPAFTIKLRPVESNKERFETFKLENEKLAKKLWRLAAEHHQFFRLKEPEVVKSGTLFPGFGSKFYRFHGRTEQQALTDTKKREKPVEVVRQADRIHRTMADNQDELTLQRKENERGTEKMPYGGGANGPHDPNEVMNQRYDNQTESAPPMSPPDQDDLEHELSDEEKALLARKAAEESENTQDITQDEESLTQPADQAPVVENGYAKTDEDRLHGAAPYGYDGSGRRPGDKDQYGRGGPGGDGRPDQYGRGGEYDPNDPDGTRAGRYPPYYGGLPTGGCGTLPGDGTYVDRLANGESNERDQEALLVDEPLRIRGAEHGYAPVIPGDDRYTTEKGGQRDATSTRKVLTGGKKGGGEDEEDQDDGMTDYDKELMDAIRQVTDMNPDLNVDKIELKADDE